MMQSDLPRAFSIKTRELDFSEPCCFYRLLKVMYHLKPKTHIDGPNIFPKSVLPIYFKAIRSCLTKPKENNMTKF